MGYFLGWLFVWVITAAVIYGTAYLLPGVTIKNYWSALVTALVLGFVNIFVRPFLLILTLPFNILTFGLLTFVINALMILLVAAIVPGFQVKNFWYALLFSLIITIIRLLLAGLFSI